MKFLRSTLKSGLLKALAIACLLVPSLSARAVTDAEMDEAKAIAAKFYVRYINNGAGYLDNWLPKSMADLEKKVSNRTDKDNLRTFKNIPTPTDYASWDKDKLVAYWSDAFFAENGSKLDQKAAANAMCKKQIKQAVGRLAIAAPAPDPLPAETAAPEETAAEASAENAGADEAVIGEELAGVEAEIQEADDLVAREEPAPVKKENSATWVYIMVLAILVAVVIFLVIYASRTMRGKPSSKKDQDSSDDAEEDEDAAEYAPVPIEEPVEYLIPSEAAERRPVSDDARMREKFAETLAAKAEEIRALNRQLNDMELHAGKLADENRRLKAEVEQLRKYVTSSQPRQSAVSDPYAREQRHRQPHESHQTEHREIYLGRVNSKGIFVRADRHAVDGQSIYKLTTVNGQSGTYTLIHNPLIEDQILDDPGKWIAGGCFAKDIFDTEGKQGIITETPGKAVFRDGAWRVERKAKIRFN